MTRNEVLDSSAEFTWLFTHEFFLELDNEVCAIWSDPRYPSGNNTIERSPMDYNEFFEGCEPHFVGRSKGQHVIRDYCGSDVVLLGF